MLFRHYGLHIPTLYKGVYKKNINLIVSLYIVWHIDRKQIHSWINLFSIYMSHKYAVYPLLVYNNIYRK